MLVLRYHVYLQILESHEVWRNHTIAIPVINFGSGVQLFTTVSLFQVMTLCIFMYKLYFSCAPETRAGMQEEQQSTGNPLPFLNNTA